MGSSIVRNIIGAILLIVLSFIIGIMAADSAKKAAVIITAVIGIIGVIALGKKVWIALLILIPLGEAVNRNPERPSEFIIAGLVLAYWIILRSLGQVRFTWRKLYGADILMFLFISYVIFSFWKNPASFNFINQLTGIQTDTVSTAAYPISIASILFYIALSSITFEKKLLLPVLKWSIIIKLIALTIMACINLRTSISENPIYSLNTAKRVPHFMALALHLVVFFYAGKPLRKLFVSPTSILGISLSALMMMYSGFRGQFARFVLLVSAIAALKKEYSAIILSVALSLGALTILHTSGSVSSLPYTVRRVLSPLPIIGEETGLAKASKGSNDWRAEMWKWALDPRTRYIKDYIWGDGIVINPDELMRLHYRQQQGNQIVNAKNRSWHNGFIYLLQSLGIVGTTLFECCLLYGLFIMWRISASLRGTPYFMPCVFYNYYYLYGFIFFNIGANGLIEAAKIAANFAYLKIFNDIANEHGQKRVRRTHYTPLLMREEKSDTVQA